MSAALSGHLALAKGNLLRGIAIQTLALVILDATSRGRQPLYTTPTWDDLVELALDKIRAFGAGQYQVVRRLRALFAALLADLPEHRRPALETQSALLSDAIEHSFRQTQRADALMPDRQGIGMSQKEHTS